MTVMNQQKESSTRNPNATPVKCSKAAKENTRKSTTGAASTRSAHCGIKFHFSSKKETIFHDSKFHSTSPKSEKVTRCHSREKSVEKQNGIEGKNSTDGKNIKVIMDTLKISRSEECRNRDKSPSKEQTPKTSASDVLKVKKPCNRCSRAPKEEKPEMKSSNVIKNKDQLSKVIKNEEQPLKIVKTHDQPLKTVKPDSPRPLKAAACKKQCSKLAKLISAEPQLDALKPKSNLMNGKKSITKESEKKVRILEKCESAPSNTEKVKPSATNMEKSSCTNEEKSEFVYSKSEKFVCVASSSESFKSDVIIKEKSEVVNGDLSEEAEIKLLNGTGGETEPDCEAIFDAESFEGAKKELESLKAASKIPRKTHGSSGIKFNASKKETIPQPFTFDHGPLNMKNQPTNDMVNVVN